MTPLGMMVLLCILHSHIVSPRSSGGSRVISTPFTTSSRQLHERGTTKRTKRRTLRNVYEKPSSDIPNERLLGENSSIFGNRSCSLRITLNDNCRNRRCRSVEWDTTRKDDIMRYIDDSAQQIASNLQALRQEDDGFESFNSNISAEEPVTKHTLLEGEDEDNNGGDEEEEQVSVHPRPESIFRNSWLKHSARRPSIGATHLSSEGSDHTDSDSDVSTNGSHPQISYHGASAGPIGGRLVGRADGDASSCNSSDEGKTSLCPSLTEGVTSSREWIGITTNSDDGSLCSDIEEHPFASEFHKSPSTILNPSCAASYKVSCTMWERREVRKAELSVLDISSAIIARVEAMPENMNYFYGGMTMSVWLGLVPSVCRLIESDQVPYLSEIIFYNDFAKLPSYLSDITICAFGTNKWETSMAIIALVERIALASLFFFLVAVAERTFKQRFLYAKFFSHLTSFRRARKSELPHFRLNKVRNIKTWLSVRSYLRKRGPQHSVDVIVSFVFLFTFLLLVYLAVEHLKDSDTVNTHNTGEALVWCLILGFFLLRFMTLGKKINRKYRNLSVLITEQINLYLQIEQKPKKKEKLMVANSVLKLAADLLKELESPYRISGFSANPNLYTITKVVILSALSGLLSEMLGFKLKLHKIEIK